MQIRLLLIPQHSWWKVPVKISVLPEGLKQITACCNTTMLTPTSLLVHSLLKVYVKVRSSLPVIRCLLQTFVILTLSQWSLRNIFTMAWIIYSRMLEFHQKYLPTFRREHPGVGPKNMWTSWIPDLTAWKEDAVGQPYRTIRGYIQEGHNERLEGF